MFGKFGGRDYGAATIDLIRLFSFSLVNPKFRLNLKNRVECIKRGVPPENALGLGGRVKNIFRQEILGLISEFLNIIIS